MSLVHHLSVSKLGEAIDGGLSPVSIVEDCLSRIKAHDGQINAILFCDPDQTLEAARRAEAEIRTTGRRGPLHGIPVALKDMIDVKGWPTTAASRLYDGRIAENDAVCVANLKAAGAIMIAKTNMHELTLGSHDNPWFGKVANPLDPSRGTAGTSSGSAAAVAAGFCAVAIGSDTGGSNRSVAAANGLFGFKPSNGLVDATGSLPTARSLDALGPIATSIADLRLTTEAMLGRPLVREGAQRPVPIKSMTIAICTDLYGADLDPSVACAVTKWLDGCRDRGARIIERAFPRQKAFVDAGLILLLHEFAQDYGGQIDAAPETVGSAVHAMLDHARRYSAQDVAAARATRQMVQNRLGELMDGVDILAIPTAPGLAPRLTDEMTRVGDTHVPFGMAGGTFRRWANMLAMPAIAIPVSSDDLFPASIQLAARPGADSALLDMALTVPNAFDG
tara:strand:- start:11830 stop:13176 length:1347 start_codon:yes stop_codon:yes gene_type:complete